MNDVITGHLEGWSVEQVNKQAYILWGFLYNDVVKRWPDGTMIHTSLIRSRDYPVSKLKKGSVVKTLNSTYELGDRIKEVKTDAKSI